MSAAEVVVGVERVEVDLRMDIFAGRLCSDEMISVRKGKAVQHCPVLSEDRELESRGWAALQGGWLQPGLRVAGWLRLDRGRSRNVRWRTDRLVIQ
jgi:hypothetical protein